MTEQPTKIDIPAACNPICEKLRTVGIPNDLNLRAIFQFLQIAANNTSIGEAERKELYGMLTKIVGSLGADASTFADVFLKNTPGKMLQGRISELEQEIETLKEEKLQALNSQIGALQAISGDSINSLVKAGSESIKAIKLNKNASEEVKTEVSNNIAVAVNEAKKEMVQKTAKIQVAVEEARKKALIDPLTQIPDKRAFGEFLTKWGGQALRKQTPLYLMTCNVDSLTKFNKNFGPKIGDFALKIIARDGILKILKNNADPNAALCARYAGDEFVILLRGGDLAKATRLAELIRVKTRTLKNIVEKESGEYIYDIITMSIGIAEIDRNFPDPKQAFVALVKNAGAALKEAKAKGKNVVVVRESE